MGKIKFNKETGEKVLAIIGAILVAVAACLVGQLDHDEYIEVNSTPLVKIQE